MSHALSITKEGRAEMFSGRGINPWHGLGTVVEGMLNSRDALRAAHLDWRVVQNEVFTWSNGGARYAAVPGHKAIAREDTGAVLSIMKDSYHPIQNAEAFEFFDAVVGEGQAVYDTAGALHGGRRVWIMARLPKALFIEGDELERNILLVTSHDGSSTLKMMHVTTRVVCQNTLSIALSNAQHTISILHRGNYKARVAEAQRALKISYGYFDQLGLLIGELAKAPFARSEMQHFTEELLPIRDGEKSPRTEKARGEIASLFTRGAGNHGRTKWDALNAVTEFVDHHRTYGKTQLGDATETRFASTLFGSGAEIKSRAVSLLTA
jgi:phage/plasmid-like protein (TIGR03299 family)